MADNIVRIAYGIAKKYGIDTQNKTPRQIFEEIQEYERKHNKNFNNSLFNYPFCERFDDTIEIKGKNETLNSGKESSLDKTQKSVKRIGVIKKIKTFEGKAVGTYNYDTGKPVELKDGYMVTFHQNESDEKGHYKSHYGRYTEQEYDEMTNKFAAENDAEIFVGVFDDEPEISFKVKDFEQAKKLMIKYNQKSLWNNAKADTEENLYYDKNKNPMKGD